MTQKRTRRSAHFKFEGALEAAKGLQTTRQIASTRAVHPNQISAWKTHLLTEGATLCGPQKSDKAQAVREAELYEQIGRLKMELAWLQKKMKP